MLERGDRLGVLVMSALPLPVLMTILSVVLGLAVGSFLNVVVHRVPAKLSVVAPASACPSCGHAIRSRDNVPVVSWILLGGRCRDCGSAISVRYPLVELTTGLLFGAVTWWVAARGAVVAGETTDLPTTALVLVALLYLMAISIALTCIDLETHTLPNRIVGPAYAVVVVLFTGASVTSGDWSALGRGAVGLAVLGLFYFVLAVAVPGGMGLGDVKLAGVLGFVLAYLGWGPLVVGAFAAFLLGGTFAIVLLLTGRAGRRSGIPFGPWMVAGAWVGVFTGPAVWHLYLGTVGLA